MHKVLGQKKCHSSDNLIDSLNIEEEESDYSNDEDYTDQESVTEQEKESTKKKTLQKILRKPPRRTADEKRKDEQKFKNDILESNRRFEKHLEETNEREERAEKRDEQFCNSVTDFMGLFGQYLKHKLNNKVESGNTIPASVASGSAPQQFNNENKRIATPDVSIKTQSHENMLNEAKAKNFQFKGPADVKSSQSAVAITNIPDDDINYSYSDEYFPETERNLSLKNNSDILKTKLPAQRPSHDLPAINSPKNHFDDFDNSFSSENFHENDESSSLKNETDILKTKLSARRSSHDSPASNSNKHHFDDLDSLFSSENFHENEESSCLKKKTDILKNKLLLKKTNKGQSVTEANKDHFDDFENSSSSKNFKKDKEILSLRKETQVLKGRLTVQKTKTVLPLEKKNEIERKFKENYVCGPVNSPTVSPVKKKSRKNITGGETTAFQKPLEESRSSCSRDSHAVSAFNPTLKQILLERPKMQTTFLVQPNSDICSTSGCTPTPPPIKLKAVSEKRLQTLLEKIQQEKKDEDSDSESYELTKFSDESE